MRGLGYSHNAENDMRKVKIGKKQVELYDSIDELPIARFYKFNKYMLIDAGIGSDIGDINNHIGKISKFIDNGDKDSAKKQLDNLRHALYLVSNETNVNHLSLAALVKSINGNNVHDLSDENMARIIGEFRDSPKSFIEKLIESIKKKVETELSLYFPGLFDDAAVKEYYDRIRQRTILKLKEIIEGEDYGSKIEEIDSFLLTLSKPKVFSGKDSAEIAYEKQFEEMCLFLQKELSVEPKSMTTLKFYIAFEHIKKVNKNKRKHGKQPNKI